MWLWLEALDVWLFRDGRPFDAGSDHRAQSLFPAYPTVVQGAIRSHHLVVNRVDLANRSAISALVGTARSVGALRLRGPFLARREGGRIVRYLAQPADAVSLPDSPYMIRPASAPQLPPDGVLTSCPTSHLLGLAEAPARGEGGLWLREDHLLAYLQGQGAVGVPEAGLFARENRLGISRDDWRRTTKRELLYEVEFIRPCADVGLLIEVEGYGGWPHRGTMRIGGEGRAAWFEQVEADPWPHPPDPLPARFKVYFATPAWFDGGWQPADGAWARYFTGDVRLVAAALPRYEAVGGYDWAGNAHKPSRRYVPAGSVYYFECGGEARLRADLIQRAVTDCATAADYEAAIGFGQVMIEEW